MSSSFDGEQPDQSNDQKDLRAAIKLARKFREKTDDYEKLTAFHESHKSYEKAIQKEKAALENELELLHIQHSDATEKMQCLENDIKEKNAIIEMLQYGTQGKCGVCGKCCKIIDSHPYSKVLLDTIFRANYSGVYDLQREKCLQPSSCKWKHLCHA